MLNLMNDCQAEKMIKHLNRKSYFFLRDPKVGGRSQGNRWITSSNFLLHKKQQHVRSRGGAGAEQRNLESRHKGTHAGQALSVFVCTQTHQRHTAQAARPRRRRTSNWSENGKAVELRLG